MPGLKRLSGATSGKSSAYRAATMRLVELPRTVHMPPSMEAKDSGMRSLDGLTPIEMAHACQLILG